MTTLHRGLLTIAVVLAAGCSVVAGLNQNYQESGCYPSASCEDAGEAGGDAGTDSSVLPDANADSSEAGSWCSPGATRSGNCGNCGTDIETCTDGGTWKAGTCSGQGVCAPDASEPCNTYGTEICGSNCAWGSCSCPDAAPTCSPGSAPTCTANSSGRITCNACGQQVSTACPAGQMCTNGACAISCLGTVTSYESFTVPTGATLTITGYSIVGGGGGAGCGQGTGGGGGSSAIVYGTNVLVATAGGAGGGVGSGGTIATGNPGVSQTDDTLNVVLTAGQALTVYVGGGGGEGVNGTAYAAGGGGAGYYGGGGGGYSTTGAATAGVGGQANAGGTGGVTGGATGTSTAGGNGGATSGSYGGPRGNGLNGGSVSCTNDACGGGGGGYGSGGGGGLQSGGSNGASGPGCPNCGLGANTWANQTSLTLPSAAGAAGTVNSGGGNAGLAIVRYLYVGASCPF